MTLGEMLGTVTARKASLDWQISLDKSEYEIKRA
jgi:hypothetical protein